MQALLNINTEKNEGNFWRPWWKLDESDKILRSATDKEYKTVLGELIRGEIILPQESAQKKKIQLEKKTEKNSQALGLNWRSRLIR